MIFVFNPVTLFVIFVLYTKTTGITKKVVMVVGAVIDVLVNITWGTVIFADIPKEYTLTQRVERLKSSTGYRGKLANLICKLLNHFEKGHCA